MTTFDPVGPLLKDLGRGTLQLHELSDDDLRKVINYHVKHAIDVRAHTADMLAVLLSEQRYRDQRETERRAELSVQQREASARSLGRIGALMTTVGAAATLGQFLVAYVQFKRPAPSAQSQPVVCKVELQPVVKTAPHKKSN